MIYQHPFAIVQSSGLVLRGVDVVGINVRCVQAGMLGVIADIKNRTGFDVKQPSGKIRVFGYGGNQVDCVHGASPSGLLGGIACR